MGQTSSTGKASSKATEPATECIFALGTHVAEKLSRVENLFTHFESSTDYAANVDGEAFHSLVNAISRGQSKELVAMLPDSSPYTIAAALRAYFKAAPEPLVPFAMFASFARIHRATRSQNGPKQAEGLRSVLGLLPEANFSSIKLLCQLFAVVDTGETTWQLAYTFGPYILANESPVDLKSAVEDSKLAISVVEVLIRHVDVFLEVEKGLLEERPGFERRRSKNIGQIKKKAARQKAKSCSVGGCTKGAFKANYCAEHHNELRHGKSEAGKKPPLTPKQQKERAVPPTPVEPADSSKCPKCSAKKPSPTVKFCTSCGTRFASAKSTPSTTQQDKAKAREEQKRREREQQNKERERREKEARDKERVAKKKQSEKEERRGASERRVKQQQEERREREKQQRQKTPKSSPKAAPTPQKTPQKAAATGDKTSGSKKPGKMKNLAAMWDAKDKKAKEEQTTNVFSAGYTGTKKLKKGDKGYGSAPEGSASAARAKKATEWVKARIIQLVGVITDIGKPGADGLPYTDFGTLFVTYEKITDTLVGILQRAKKYGVVTFEGEMLFQGQSDRVVIALTAKAKTYGK